MTYNVFSGTLNPTHFTSLHVLLGRIALLRRCVSMTLYWDKNLTDVTLKFSIVSQDNQ